MMINREKVIEELEKANNMKFTETSMTIVLQWVVRDALELLRKQETIVRCKDCKHFDKSFSYDANKGYCSEIRHDDDWFCADGEEK